MRLNKIISVAVSCAMLFASCAERDVAQDAAGYLDLSVTCDQSLQIVPVTKVEGEAQAISLTVYDSKDNVVAQWDDVAQITEPVVMQTGRYKAVAAMGEQAGPVAFDSPYYTGSTEFSIRPNVITTADVVCKLSSVKVTAQMSSEITEDFEYELTVSNGEGELIFDEQTLGREGYFAVTGELEWTLELVNAKNEKFVFSDKYTSVKAAQHYALTFSVVREDNGPQGAADFRIQVDDSLNEPKIHDVVVVIDKSAPTVFGPDVITRYMADNSKGAVVEIDSSLPFGSITMTHDNEALAAAGVPSEVDFMSMTDFSVLVDAGVVVTIKNQAGEVEQAVSESTKTIALDFSALVDRLEIGNYSVVLRSANATGKEVAKEVGFKVLSSMGSVTFDPWAKFVYFKGTWLSENTPSGLSLQYRLSGTSEWIDMDASLLKVDAASRKVSGFVCGLSASSSYELRLVSADEAGATLSTTTEAAPQLYNMSFDDWCSENGGAPYASNANPKIWDTANPGTSSMSVYPTTQEKDNVISGSAVRMESTYASMLGIGKFAAGNIYTGAFKSVQTSPMGATLDWGVAFTGRPLGLKGYYKYAPVAIDYVGSGYEDMKGQPDICQIQAALMNWSGPFEINTGKNQFVDFSKSNKTMLAHNDLVAGTTNGSWIEFNMYLSYRNIATRPSYVIVSACASRYGDYFTGGKGSVMWVDEFQFIYDPMELSETDRNAFFALFK